MIYTCNTHRVVVIYTCTFGSVACWWRHILKGKSDFLSNWGKQDGRREAPCDAPCWSVSCCSEASHRVQHHPDFLKPDITICGRAGVEPDWELEDTPTGSHWIVLAVNHTVVTPPNTSVLYGLFDSKWTSAVWRRLETRDWDMNCLSR